MPSVVSPPLSAARAAESHGASPSTPEAGRRFRILVVDDMPAIHGDFHKILGPTMPSPVDRLDDEIFGGHRASRQVGVTFELDDALQGAEGVECVRRALASNQPYAVAFVDMRMPPGQDGLATVLQMWGVDPHLQIVICSAHSDYSWTDIISATGDTDQLVILRKPFDPIEVMQLAHALSKKWEVQQALRRQVDTLEVIVAERTRQLEERQALFQLILENATDLIAVVDAHGRRIYNSPSYEAVLGFSPAELQATHAFAQIHPEDLPAVKAAADLARQTGRGETLVYRMQHRDGTWRTLESCAGVVRAPDGNLAYLVIVARDITTRVEQDLKRQLGQKLESIGRLAAGIAHEINTPTQYITDNTRFLADAFRSLNGFVQQCRTEHAPAGPSASGRNGTGAAADDIAYLEKEIPQALEQNLEGLARIARIVGSLKEFSHPNSTDKAPADLNRIIETTLAISRHEWKYVADVETELDPALPPVPCVVDEINQVLLNLVVNAAHTIAEALAARGETRGKITLRSRSDGGAVRIEVADTGMGIPPQLRSRIFEPFFTTKGVGKGTGQGLALVHSIVVHHHAGNIDFTTEIGRGTTFRLWLPLRPGVETAPAR